MQHWTSPLHSVPRGMQITRKTCTKFFDLALIIQFFYEFINFLVPDFFRYVFGCLDFLPFFFLFFFFELYEILPKE